MVRYKIFKTTSENPDRKKILGGLILDARIIIQSRTQEKKGGGFYR